MDKLEQGYHAVKEKISDVKSGIKQKAGEIADDFRQKGKEALNKAAEFLGIKKKLQDIRQNVQKTITEVDKTIVKIDAFGTGMREAGQKIANAFRALADKPEKEYGEKKFSKTEMIKKIFLSRRKLLSRVLKFTDAVIEKTEQITADVKQYQTDQKTEREKEISTRIESVIPILSAAESGYQYGAEAYGKRYKEEKVNTPQKKIDKITVTKSR